MATITQTAKKPTIRQTQCFIGGQWTPAASGKTFQTIDPATENVICEVAEGDKADVEAAAQAARKAFEHGPWSRMDARDRGQLMFKLADLMEEEIDELAALESWDNGKPIRDARNADLPLAIDCLRYYAGLADKIQGDTIPDPRKLLLLHAARTGRRRGADHSLELSHPDDGLEVGTGPGGRLHDRHEAGRANAAHVSAHGPVGTKGRHSRRCHQCRPGLRTHGRRGRSSNIPGSTRLPSPASTSPPRSLCGMPHRR